MLEMFGWLKTASRSTPYQLDYEDAIRLSKLIVLIDMVNAFQNGESLVSTDEFYGRIGAWMPPEWPTFVHDGIVVLHDGGLANKQILNVPAGDLMNGLKNCKEIADWMLKLNEQQKRLVSEIAAGLGRKLVESTMNPSGQVDAGELQVVAKSFVKAYWKERVGSLEIAVR